MERLFECSLAIEPWTITIFQCRFCQCALVVVVHLVFSYIKKETKKKEENLVTKKNQQTIAGTRFDGDFSIRRMIFVSIGRKVQYRWMMQKPWKIYDVTCNVLENKVQHAQYLNANTFEDR